MRDDVEGIPPYLADVAAVAVARLDAAGQVVAVNRGFRILAGADDAPLPWPAAGLFLEPTFDALRAAQPGGDGTRAYRGPLVLRGPTGPARPVPASAYRAGDALLVVVEPAPAADADRLEQLERELAELLRHAAQARAPVTASLFGRAPLREAAPEVFNQLRQRYEAVLDRALDERQYQVTHHLSDALRELADHLGFLRAGPRDVVELHSAALRARTGASAPRKAQAYLEEGRLLVLELMGHLAAYYRAQAGAPARGELA